MDQPSCLEIIGGDGNQEILGKNLRLKESSEQWFDNRLHWTSSITENAALFKVTSQGKYDGRYILLTSRVTMSLEKQLSSSGVASVIIHLIDSSFTEGVVSLENSSAEGMGFVKRCSQP